MTHFRKAYLEITNVCNLHCSFCPGTLRPPVFLAPDRFRVLARKIRPLTDYLYLHVMGEPLLHPRLAEILAICAELGFRVILTTNGTLLGEREALLFSAPALYKVNISLHSFEANAGDNIAGYLEGCCRFADLASKRELLTVLRLWNENAPAMPGRNSENGQILSYLRKRLPGEWEPNTKGLRIRHRLHLEWDEIFAWPSLTAPVQPPHGCFGLRDHFAVLSDGRVIPCCLDREGVLSLGNLFTESAEELLFSPEAKRLRAELERGEPSCDLCRRCGYAAARFPTE